MTQILIDILIKFKIINFYYLIKNLIIILYICLFVKLFVPNFEKFLFGTSNYLSDSI